MDDFIIDDELSSELPALSGEELDQLEKNILADGEVRDPLIIWNNTIVDGHHRWQIIQKHPEIPYQVKKMEFQDKWEAKLWIDENALGQRNMTEALISMVRAKDYENSKHSCGGWYSNRYTKSPEPEKDSSSSSTDEELKRGHSRGAQDTVAKKYHVGPGVIQRDVEMYRGIKAAEEISPGFEQAVAEGKIKATKKLFADIARAPEEDRLAMVDALKEGRNSVAESLFRSKKPKKPFFEEPDRKFGVEDFGKELEIIVERMDDDFNRYFVCDYADMLLQESGRKAAYDALKKGQDILDTYKGVVDCYNN